MWNKREKRRREESDPSHAGLHVGAPALARLERSRVNDPNIKHQPCFSQGCCWCSNFNDMLSRLEKCYDLWTKCWKLLVNEPNEPDQCR